MSDTVQWPGQIVGAAGSDLSPPVVKLLRDTKLLSADASKQDQPCGNKPDWASVAIESDATAIAKQVGRIIVAVGGLSAVGAVIAAFWRGSDAPIRVVTLGGTAVLLAASAIALAIVVRADVTARAHAAAAHSQARGMVIRAFIEGTAAAVTPGRYMVQRRSDSLWLPVINIGRDATGLAITALGGDILHNDDVAALLAWPQEAPPAA